MRGKFSERLGLWRWRDQTGGRLGNPQHHGVAVGDEEIAHTVGARASRDQRKTTPEEWMPRVCDFHFSQVVYQWVVDRGMKLFDPSKMWPMRSQATSQAWFCPEKRTSHQDGERYGPVVYVWHCGHCHYYGRAQVRFCAKPLWGGSTTRLSGKLHSALPPPYRALAAP